MNKECKYVESAEYGNYCSLSNQSCNNSEPNENCEHIEEYWKYLEEMGVQVVTEEEIEEWLN